MRAFSRVAQDETKVVWTSGNGGVEVEVTLSEHVDRLESRIPYLDICGCADPTQRRPCPPLSPWRTLTPHCSVSHFKTC